MTEPLPWYPVLLDLRGRNCLVVGGGQVGARKAAGLLDCGATVTMVSISVNADARSLVGRSGFELVERAYRTSDLRGVWLVVTAIDDSATTARVHDDAETARVWMNAADDPKNCSVILPATHRDGDVLIAVSTGGASPAAAGWLRDRIAVELGDLPGRLVDGVKDVRDRVRIFRSSEGLPWRSLVDALATADADAHSLTSAWLTDNCLPSECGSCGARCGALE